MKLPLKVITPRGCAFEGDVDALYCPCAKGPIGILPGHAPFMSPVVEGATARIEKLGKSSSYRLGSGLLDVRGDGAYLLVSSFEETEGDAKIPE